MKTMPINNSTNHNTFRGLWKDGNNIAVEADSISVSHVKIDYYYPFLNEPQDDIQRALRDRTYHYSCGSADTFSVDIFDNYAELKNELPFTREEYNAYKNFYGKTMPESIKKIEDELIKNGFEKYLNRGLIYNIKKFIHNLKK